jgi:hypothetical protein
MGSNAGGVADTTPYAPMTIARQTLDQDLIEVPESGVATIMADEFFSVYDKTGPGMSNYKP